MLTTGIQRGGSSIAKPKISWSIWLPVSRHCPIGAHKNWNKTLKIKQPNKNLQKWYSKTSRLRIYRNHLDFVYCSRHPIQDSARQRRHCQTINISEVLVSSLKTLLSKWTQKIEMKHQIKMIKAWTLKCIINNTKLEMNVCGEVKKKNWLDKKCYYH